MRAVPIASHAAQPTKAIHRGSRTIGIQQRQILGMRATLTASRMPHVIPSTALEMPVANPHAATAARCMAWPAGSARSAASR
jgi:hypothetical protein